MSVSGQLSKLNSNYNIRYIFVMLCRMLMLLYELVDANLPLIDISISMDGQQYSAHMRSMPVCCAF